MKIARNINDNKELESLEKDYNNLYIDNNILSHFLQIYPYTMFRNVFTYQN